MYLLGGRTSTCPAKIGQFRFAPIADQYIFGLEITMNNVFGMNVNKRVRNLINILKNYLKIKH